MNTGEAAPRRGPGGASDFIGLAFHGLTITHLDSLCHQFWDGQMYNGKPASLVTVQQKATAGDIDQAQHGVVTRGVLLDITHVRGKEWLEAGEGVFPEDLEAADAAQGVDPSGYPTIGLPIHKVGIVAMGLWLLDAADCEALVDVCRRLRRWEFMFVVAPLRFHHATGSPVNPLA